MPRLKRDADNDTSTLRGGKGKTMATFGTPYY